LYDVNNKIVEKEVSIPSKDVINDVINESNGLHKDPSKLPRNLVLHLCRSLKG